MDPRILGDYLLAQGVTSRAIESPEGWAIWVHNEDHVARASEALAAFERDPNDPRFADAATAAKLEREKAEALDRQYRKNVRDLSGRLDHIPLRRRPVTMILATVCIVLFLIGGINAKASFTLRDDLCFFPREDIARPDDKAHGLDAIYRGEIWRLVTPIFLHGGLLHIFFNLTAIVPVGTAIEVRRGSWTLVLLVLVSAIVSNLGEYVYQVNFKDHLNPWVGISGVAFAMLGYVWMKGLFEPEHGIGLPTSTVRFMLLWLVIGFSGFLPIANGAHLAGLISGMLFGLARF